MAAVGILVAALVFILGLFPRLNSADDLLNDLEPAFQEERVEGARAGVTMVSNITDLAEPITTESGTAPAEVQGLVAFVSEQSGLPPAAVLDALQTNFPHTTDLLLALPLSEVTAELPKLVAFLSETLKLPPEEVTAAIAQNFPGLAQVITNLPKVTDGFDQVPGTENLTRFDGSQVSSVPDVRDYFAEDVIPILETQQDNFDSLNGLPGGPALIPPLLLLLGIVVAIFGFVMSRASAETRGAPAPWAVVTVVGIVVCVLVVGLLQLFSRLDDGQEVLDNAEPAFVPERVEGARAGINMVSVITDTFDPITTDSGTAAAEVPELVAFVSETSGLPPDAVLAALETNFPHTTDLLQALPLSEVVAELPQLVAFLADTLKISEAEVVAAVEENFPGLAQVIGAAPKVTGGWDQVPGTEGMTRFDG
ncbi:MAG: hypothetical protein M3M99_04570, partial [Actinomycetota bacterium]|nr:hypothetical protein [Actinomycetota bacterium]